MPQLRDMILGDLGTYVNLTFLREKGGEEFRYDLDLVRGEPNKVKLDMCHARRYGAEH